MREESANCRCECGAVQFSVRRAPLMRGFCHCTICQRFNAVPFADFTVFRGRDVELPAPGLVHYESYRSPPLLRRGTCMECSRPAVECVRMVPKVVLVPTANIRDPSMVPEPSLHIFYDTRTADVDDDLPKYSGYLKSQAAFSVLLMRGLLRTGAPASPPSRS